MNDETTGGCCGGVNTNPAAERGARPDLLAVDDDATTCPVMAGSPVSTRAAEAAGLFRDVDGQRYRFCCAGCGPAFDADPARYTQAA